MSSTRQPLPFRWPDNARAGVCLTFDDTRPSQLDNGLAILNRHNVKGTFFATLRAVEKRLEDWQTAAKQGHELANHTTTHPCTGNFGWSSKSALENMSLGQMERDILDASDVLAELTGQRPTTFAYPCGQTFVGRGVNLQSYIPLVARHFTAGRGWRNESMADPAFCDLAQVPGMALDNLTWEQAHTLIRQAIDKRHWLVFAGHDVNTDGRQSIHAQTLEKVCEYCRDPANGIWIDTFAAMADHIQQQQQLQPHHQTSTSK